MASIRCLSMLIAPRGVVPRPVLGPQKEPRAGFGRGDGGGVGSAVGSGLGLWLGADVSGVGTGEGRGEGMDVGRVVGARVGGGEDVFDGAGVGAGSGAWLGDVTSGVTFLSASWASVGCGIIILSNVRHSHIFVLIIVLDFHVREVLLLAGFLVV